MQSPAVYVSLFADGNLILATNPLSLAPAASRDLDAPALRVVYQDDATAATVWHKKLSDFERLGAGWNGYSAPAPSGRALITAKNFVSNLLGENYRPKRVAPSVVGGIGVTHKKGERCVYVEFYNDGRVFALFSDGKSEPVAKEISPGHQPFKRLIAEMREYLDG